ncbi:transposase [Streptosporangium soli]|nr:transposase [Streptosporangium sp. KLBMP 9127]
MPTAGCIDSQTVKAAENVGAAACGFDGGKKVKGQKRHIAVDTLGLLLCVIVTAASVQDRDGAHPLLARLREKFSTIALVWAATPDACSPGHATCHRFRQAQCRGAGSWRAASALIAMGTLNLFILA